MASKAINWKSPVPYLVIVFGGAAAVAIGVYGDRAGGGGSGSRRAKPARVAQDGYSYPVPKGYSVATGELQEKVRATGGTAVFADRRIGGPQAFRGSVAVVPVRLDPVLGEAQLEVMAQPEKLCAEMRRRLPTTQNPRVVKLPSGAACQTSGQAPDHPFRMFIMTTLKHPRKPLAWVVTCNQDSRDPGAARACHRVLDGWRFE